MNKKIFGGLITALSLACVFQACSPAGGENTGHEYMPDMAHSVAYEANKIDEYSLHTWNDGSVRTVNQLWGTPRLPVKGTIPRGYVGLSAHNNSVEYADLLQKGVYTPINGNMPYYYSDNEEERTRANKEIVMNPFPITKRALENGKNLYKIYCGICHGDKAGGDGYLAREESLGGKYPAQPANLLLDTFVNGNNGRLYHAIMYGKNVMGGYADKLSYEERWDVIHYIRACQAGEKSLQYDEKWNTLKPTAAISDSLYQITMASKKVIAPKVTTKAGAVPVKTETPIDPHNTKGENLGH